MSEATKKIRVSLVEGKAKQNSLLDTYPSQIFISSSVKYTDLVLPVVFRP